jgi:DNA-binding beta-propeller fold protein YncE
MRKYLCFMTTLGAIACGGDDTSNLAVELPATDEALCVALGADYRNNAGTMAVVGLPSLTVLRDRVPAAISGDPVLRAYGDRLFVVNRTANNVTIIDPTVTPWAVESQFSTGENSNPQDLALDGDRAYVPLYNKGFLQVWDVSQKNPAAPVATVDLSSYDEDGVPNANSVVVTGGRAYVTLDLLDTQMFPQPRGKGKVVVIDTGTNQATAALELRYENPYDFMFEHDGRLLVSTFADFSGTRGCLEQISLAPTAQVESCVVENSTLGGTINVIAPAGDELILAVSAFGPPPDYEETAQLRRIDAGGALVAGSLTPEGQIPTDVAYAPSGHLVYSDRESGGLRVHDLAGNRELTTTALDIGLTPALANAIVCFGR